MDEPRANKRGQYLLFGQVPTQPTLRDVANAVREAGVEALPSAVALADHARYQEVRVQSALASAAGMPFTWSLNPYRGCTHACEYCYARKYQRHLELGAGDDFSSVILVKRNVVAVLEREPPSSELDWRAGGRRDGHGSVSADRGSLPADPAVPRGAG